VNAAVIRAFLGRKTVFGGALGKVVREGYAKRVVSVN